MNIYYVCPTLVRVPMKSTVTLPRVYPWVGHTMYIQPWSEYPWNPWILCQGGIHGLAILCMSNVSQSIHGICGYFAKGIHGLVILCMSNIGQSIHGIHGYFAKGVSIGLPYYVWPTLVRVSMESADTLPRGYPWVGHTMYVQR